MIDDMKAIGERIKEVRKKLGLTQDEFGKLFNIGRTSLGKIETGKILPSPYMLLILRQKHNISIDYLFTGKEKPIIQDYPGIPDDPETRELLERLQDKVVRLHLISKYEEMKLIDPYREYFKKFEIKENVK